MHMVIISYWADIFKIYCEKKIFGLHLKGLVHEGNYSK